MKHRSAPLDELWNELQFVLDDDGRRVARIVRNLFTWAYRALCVGLLVALRLAWRKAAFPELGSEPFNLSEAELEREWGLR